MNTLLIAVTLARLVGGSGPLDLDSVGWLSGCWESRHEGRRVIEVWSPPVGGLMVGVGLTSVPGRDPSFEHLRIESKPGGGILYTASPSGQVDTPFASTQLTDHGFTVENPTHDFPTRIEYERQSADSFVATVQGPDGEGGLQGFEMEFLRSACSSSP